MNNYANWLLPKELHEKLTKITKKEDIDGSGIQLSSEITYKIELPIEMASLDLYKNNEGSTIINDMIENHLKDVRSGRSNAQKLVLTNSAFPKTIDDDNKLEEFGHAGFTTIFIVIATVLLTSLYIAYFIAK